MGWIPRNERTARLGILGVATLLLALVVGIFGYRWYNENFLRPDKTILAAAEETFSLGYFSDRLGPFILSNPNTSSSIAPQALLAQLEEEALTLQLAAARDIVLTDEDITAAIAESLGVPVGTGAGGAFDNLYRARLTDSGMSDSNYRRLVEASEVDRLLGEDIRAEIGETGETVMLRLVVVDTQEEGDAIFARINDGEDMGSIAQVTSIHVQSRVEDGLFITPPALLGEEVRTAIEGLEVGTLVEPFESDGDVWVVRLERRDAEGTFTDDQVSALVELEFDELLAKARLETNIERNLSSDDVTWALDKVTVPSQPMPQPGGHGG